MKKFLKDYNAQTIWASINPASFMKPETKWPKWLNIAFGYGANNMYGGFENSWINDNGDIYVLEDHDRYQQYYLAPDIDLTRIPVKSKPLKALLFVLNIFKIPSPALEVDSRSNLKFHWIFF
jgi:hypothetical protein